MKTLEEQITIAQRYIRSLRYDIGELKSENAELEYTIKGLQNKLEWANHRVDRLTLEVECLTPLAEGMLAKDTVGQITLDNYKKVKADKMKMEKEVRATRVENERMFTQICRLNLQIKELKDEHAKSV